MRPDPRFTSLNKGFWANVRSIGEAVGYTARGTRQIKVHTIADMVAAMRKLGLAESHIAIDGNRPTELGERLSAYFEFRANILNIYVEPRLMDAERASNVFWSLNENLNPSCPIPMNKQKGAKKAPAYLTGIVNMLVEANACGISCDYDPRSLTTFTRDGQPLRTFARRVDGCFPSTVNPLALWEIKEYYYTTTFGSRVADGVYESLLDGMELEELREREGIQVDHLLILDSHFTWWDCGRSYLCRIIDLLHMGYVSEVLFGYEVVERLPTMVKSWTAAYRDREKVAPVS